VSGVALSETARTTKEWPRLHDEVDTLAERLTARGYASGAVTSFTWLRKDRGFGQGFEHFDESAWSTRHPEREHTGDLACAAAVEMHATLAKGSAPLFLWLHLFDPHDKYVEHAGIDFGDDLSARYDGEIAFTDRQLATFIDAVSTSERGARTLWIVHGSHGEAFGEHGQTGHGAQLYDEAIRIPLLAVDPSQEPGRFDKAAVSVMDIAPTVLDYAGAPLDGVGGVSLRGAIEGSGQFTRAPVISYANRRVAVVDWPLKLMVFRRDGRDDRLLLFDMAIDPGEEKDIAGDRQDDLARLAKLY
jgi:arylsulfatase A-like enzyme